MLTQEYLKSILDYNAETGIFTWKVTKGPKAKIGYSPGNKNKKTGYISFSINYKRYYCHRLAWLYIYGEFPNSEIDHINRNKSDNRIENLRCATRSQNLANTKLAKNNNCGYKNISLHKKTGLWRFVMHKKNKCVENKYFKTLNEAIEYSIKSRKINFGSFANDY